MYNLITGVYQMFRSIAKKIALTFVIFATFILLINVSFGKDSIKRNISNNKNVNWKVAITSDTKDSFFENTQEITFKTPDNLDVAEGKFAPGMTAIAELELDLIGTNVPVEFSAKIDKNNLLYKNFKLTATLDGENYNFGRTKLIELENNSPFNASNGKKILQLQLEWKSYSNEMDNIIGSLGENIKIPITMNLKQHIQ